VWTVLYATIGVTGVAWVAFATALDATIWCLHS
jgi:tryptophan-rich sensory protein